jgi:hypothetical protein
MSDEKKVKSAPWLLVVRLLHPSQACPH